MHSVFHPHHHFHGMQNCMRFVNAHLKSKQYHTLINTHIDIMLVMYYEKRRYMKSTGPNYREQMI